jgi:hypothetical protein
MDDMEFKAHFDHTKDTLNHIRMDVDNLLKKGETTMGEDMGWLAAMLNKQGVDPAVLAMLDKDRDNGALGDNGLVLLFLILLLGGGNGFGFGRNGPMDGVAGVDRTVVNEANYSRLMDAVAGNRDAIAGLAQTLNCDMNSIQSALCGVDKALAVNQGSIINAIQSCCCTLQGKIQECCCETNRNIERQGCQTRSDIQETRFLISNQFAAQTQLMQQLACDNRAYLADQFCQIKTREDAREIQALREKLADAKADSRMVAIMAAVNNRDSVSGTLDTTAGTWTGSIS